MATFEKIMQSTVSYLTKTFGSTVADAFMEYIEDEEIEESDVVTNDINGDMSTSSIVEFVGDKFSWDDNKKQSFFVTLQICFLHTNITNPFQINWTDFVNSELQQTRQYINKQCFNALPLRVDNDAFITIQTIGRNNNINIVPLLFDIYSFYKYKNMKTYMLNTK
eukprot:286373_1